jgi:hypothetical protein
LLLLKVSVSAELQVEQKLATIAYFMRITSGNKVRHLTPELLEDAALLIHKLRKEVDRLQIVNNKLD